MAKAAASTGAFSATSQKHLSQLGSSMQSVGKRMTTFISLPIAGLGALSAKMAMDFETSFAQMVGLANVPAEEIDHLKEAVLALSGETAQAPQDLADALYLAASAGLDSSTALDVVSVAAQGAAAGMGSTATVVDLLTTVIGSYGASNISAAEAADVLTAAVREGKAAPDEMAQALGRVLPVSAALGISFGETAGAVAFLTNVGLDTDEAVTSLRATMLALISPSAQATQTLADAGISMDDMRAAIQERGLMGALDLLREHGFADNTEALSHVIENTRGLVGAQALLADESGRLGPIMDATANSSGALGDAFTAVSDTDAFKMRQALTDLKVAMISVGAVLLPIAADIAGAMSNVAKFFSDLPGPVQGAVVAFGGLLAVGGPLVMVAGSIIKNLGLITTVFGGMPAPIGGAARAFTAFGIAAAVGLVAWKILDEGHLNAGVSIGTTADALIRATSAGFAEAVAAGEATGQIDSLALAHEALSQAIAENADDDLTAAFNNNNVAASDYLEVLTNLRTGMSSTGDQTVYIRQTLDLLEARFGKGRQAAIDFYETVLLSSGDATGAIERMSAAYGISQGELQSAADDMELLKTAAIENTGQINEMALAYLNTVVAIGGVGAEALAAAEAIAGNRREGYNAIAVYEEYVHQLTLLEPAQRDAALAGNDMTAALAGLSPEAVAAALGLDATGTAAETLYNKIPPAANQIKELRLRAEELTTKLDLLGSRAITAGDKLAGFGDKVLAGGGFGTIKDVIAAMGEAFDASAPKVAGLGDRVSATGDKFGALADDVEEAAGGVEEFAGVAGSTIDMLTWAEEKFNDAARAAHNYSDELARISGNMGGVQEGEEAVWEWALKFNDALAAQDTELGHTNRSLAKNTLEGLENRDLIEEQISNILSLNSAYIDNGMSVEDASAATKYNAEQLVQAATNAGFAEDQVRALLAQYGLTPEFVATAIIQGGMKTAKEDITELSSKYDNIPPEIATQIEAAIDRGDYDEAKRLLNELELTRFAAVITDLRGAWEANAYLNAIAAVRNAYIYVHTVDKGKGYAEGGYIGSPVYGATIGEAGPEVILPLNNPARMAALLGMSSVGPKVAAALGNLIPASGGGGGYSGGGGGGVHIDHVNVYMPPGANGDDVLRSLRQLQRRGGPIPLATR